MSIAPEADKSEQATHCEHWLEGSDECHRCGHFPMTERLAYVVGVGPKPVDPPCVQTGEPCPDRVTWKDKLPAARGSEAPA